MDIDIEVKAKLDKVKESLASNKDLTAKDKDDLVFFCYRLGIHELINLAFISGKLTLYEWCTLRLAKKG